MKIEIGQLVVERINPARKLIVTKYSQGVYYVKDLNYYNNRKDLVFFENQISRIENDDKAEITPDIFNSSLESLVRWLNFSR